MAQITVATQSTSNGKNQGRPAGVQVDNSNLWIVEAKRESSEVRFFYSTNKGASWTQDTGATIITSFPQHSCMYAIGNKVWVMYDSVYGPTDNFIVFKWGTLNSGRTAITWAGGSTFLWEEYSTDYAFAQSMAVHAQGSGYRAHCAFTSYFYAENRYARLSLNSSGVYTSTDVSTSWSSGGQTGTNDMGRVLIDPATKDVFLLAMTNLGGGDRQLWFQKRAYSGGTWPAGTVRNLGGTTGTYASNMNAAFDGDRVVAVMYDNDLATNTPVIVERDKADTTTTTRTPPTGISGSMTANTTLALQTNAQKDVLITWNDIGTDPTDVYKNTYNRAGNSWAGATLVLDTAPNTDITNQYFIDGTKYFFFMGTDSGNRPLYMLDNMLEATYTGSARLQAVATMTASPSFTIAGGVTIPRPFVEIAFATDPTSATPIWSDITEWVVDGSIRRGKQDTLDVTEPGELHLTLDNDDRRFDPSNTTSPYYPNVLPVRRVRVRAIWNNQIYDVFNGYVKGWPQSYPSKHQNLVTVDGIDGLGFLSFAELNDVSRPQELSHLRVSAILNSANWPTEDRAIDTGIETFSAANADNQLLSGSALSLLQQCGSVEHGRLFASKDGKITFHSRDRTIYNPPSSKGVWNDGLQEWDSAGHSISFDGAGSVTFNANGTITVSDGGVGDFWSTADTGTILWRTLSVPGQVEVDVTSDLSTTEANLRFLGIRSSTASNAAMFMLLTDADNSHFSTVWRDTDGGTAAYQGENVGPAYSDTLPVRAKITYDGTTARAYVSQDGGKTYSLINSRAISGLDVAYLANGGGAGTHVSTTYAPVALHLYDDIVPSMDEEKIWNRVTVSREGGTPQVAQDLTSQAAYFVRDLSHGDEWVVTDGDALAHAQYLLSVGKDPKLRFTSTRVDPRSDSAYAAALSLELGDHIIVQRFLSSQISQDVFVDGIQSDFSRDDKSWDFTFYLTPVPVVSDWWIVGTSLLGTNTRLAF